MNTELQPYEKAGQVYILVGWMGLASTASAILFVGIVMCAFDTHPYSETILTISGLVVAILVALSLLDLILGKAIQSHKQWARVVGIVEALFSLLFFPMGTLIGAFVLRWLVNGWDQVGSE